MRRLLSDPLLHFLAAGALLFAVGNALKPPTKSKAEIVVGRDALLEFIQYRSKAFEPQAAEKLLESFTDEERRQIVADYVREEALTREAETLGLDANDYVIRQRMVQKVEFLAEASATPRDPSEDEVVAYYDANADRYRSPPAATLTHVFVALEGKTPEVARRDAEALLATLVNSGAGFTDATKYGDRFLFHKNYVDRTDDYIESQLGPEVKTAAFDEKLALNVWRGPYRSQYGEHLLFVASRSPARLAPLDEIRETVKADLAEEQRQQAIDRAIDEIVAKYAVIDETGGE